MLEGRRQQLEEARTYILFQEIRYMIIGHDSEI
jgi:hypothetical protein